MNNISQIWQGFERKEKVIIGGLFVIGISYYVRVLFHIWGYEQLPIDLALRYHEIQALFIEGQNIFYDDNQLLYPPSFLFLLTPILGFIPYDVAGYAWFAINTLALCLILRESFYLLCKHNISRHLSLLGVCGVFAWHASYQGMGIGQVTVVLMALFIRAFNTIEYRKKNLIRSLGILFCYSLIIGKYTIFLPVFLYLLFVQKHRAYVLNAIALNLLISISILTFYDIGISEYIQLYMSKFGGGFQSGSLDLFSISKLIGLPDYLNYTLSVSILLVPLWAGIKKYPVLTGASIAFLTGRIWIYHGLYDNLMLLIVALMLLKMNSSLKYIIAINLILILPAFLWAFSLTGYLIQISFFTLLVTLFIFILNHDQLKTYNHSCND